MIQILVPISSRSQFFPAKEFYFPKPLVEVAERPMIDLVISQLKQQVPSAGFTFVLDREDARSFSLDSTVRLAAPSGAKVVERLGDTSGALCSCLLAIDALDHDAPLLIANSDQVIDADISRLIDGFTVQNVDAGVVTFDAVHPRWSYIVEDTSGNVVETVEKKVVSRHAVAGLYYFRTARTFIDAAKRVILSDTSVDGVFYISSSLNEILLTGGAVRHAPIDAAAYHSFYAPSRIAAFEASPLAARLRHGPPGKDTLNVIIPAAGEGSRFAAAGWTKPKPFIDVDGQPMLSKVVDNVATEGAQVTALMRDTHIKEEASLVAAMGAKGVDIQTVSALTEGTACTVLLARAVYDNDRPMMVANADQFVDIDFADFVSDCVERRLDGSILVFRDPSLDPKWSYAKVNDEGLVTEVAEKKPISDLATVGIYLFTRGRDYVSAAADMIAANDRINGEFYTCPVYNYMIRNGARIGVYEIPVEAMSGLGTPEDLNAFLEARSLPASASAPA